MLSTTHHLPPVQMKARLQFHMGISQHKKQNGTNFTVHAHVVGMDWNVWLRASVSSASLLRFECNKCGKTFSTKNNCQRHRRNIHGSNSSSPFIENEPTSIQEVTVNLIPVLLEKKKWECPYPTCKRKGKGGFNRRDNLIQHCRNVHNQNIPKRQRQS